MAAMNVKDAVKAAKNALLELYEDDSLTAMALEEVEKTQEEGRVLWAVTLGFDRNKLVPTIPAASISLLAPPVRMEQQRIYKTLFIDAQTGEFVKMDIRQVQ